jgi:hypothetical protein
VFSLSLPKHPSCVRKAGNDYGGVIHGSHMGGGAWSSGKHNGNDPYPSVQHHEVIPGPHSVYSQAVASTARACEMTSGLNRALTTATRRKATQRNHHPPDSFCLATTPSNSLRLREMLMGGAETGVEGNREFQRSQGKTLKNSVVGTAMESSVLVGSSRYPTHWSLARSGASPFAQFGGPSTWHTE